MCRFQRRVTTYHVTVAGKHAHSEFIHIHIEIFCTVGQPLLSRLSLQVSAYIAHHLKALLKQNLKLILPLSYTYVAEAVP